jgi:sugar O-acyltransferase (sialic acid O-acetyltransferase NeuD family)
MARVIVFGAGDCASLANYYLEHDSEHVVAGFTVSRDYLPADKLFLGKPIVPFEELTHHYSPAEFAMLAPMSAHRMNRSRRDVYWHAKEQGYRFISYVSSRATVFPGTPVGENCFILEDCTIQPFCRIGDNVMVWSGSVLAHHCDVSDHVMFAPRVATGGHCTIERFSFLGVNASIRNRLRIAEGTLVAMGANVCRDTESWGVYVGNPARRRAGSSKEILDV